MREKRILIFVIVFTLMIKPVVSGQQAPEYERDSLNDMTLHVIPQSHIDLSWWWRYDPSTVHVVVKHTLETAFDNMDKYPDYTFTFLQVPAMEPLEKYYPDLFYKLRYYVHNRKAIGPGLPNPGASGTRGRLAIGSGLWCEPDGSVPCGESLVRHCLYGKRWFKYQFDIDVKTAWFQDAWTHPWTYPQILKKSGMDSYMFKRGTTKDMMFWWESADGSRVLAYKPLATDGNTLSSPQSIDNYLLSVYRRYGIHDGVTLIGVGNHGGGAIKADIERMQQVMQDHNSGQKQASIIFSKPDQFMTAVLKSPGNIPVWRNEIEPTIRGSYTTAGEIKKGNRYSENLLMTLEKFSSAAFRAGFNSYPAEKIYDCWKKLMINQFHDPISGTDILPSIDDVLKRYREIQDTSSLLLQGELTSLAKNINTPGEGKAIIVFNPLSWDRTDIVEAEIESPGRKFIKIIDKNNQSVPYQVIGSNSDGMKRIIFDAKEIPSVGYSTFHISSEKSAPVVRSSLKAGRLYLENDFYLVKIDSVTGLLKSVTDKRNGREIIKNGYPGNLIQIIDDFGDSEGFLLSPKGEREYNLWTGNKSDVTGCSGITLSESGPVRATIQVKREFDLARFTQSITLYNAIDRIDFELLVDWKGKDKMVKISFPLNIQNSSATYEIPYGTIERPSLGEEQAAQQWVDISGNDYGVSLLNDSRYGYDVTENTIRLSVLRSPGHPVENMDDRGVHLIRYSLYPHHGKWTEGSVMNKGYEFNNRLIAVEESNHKGFLPGENSFIRITPSNLIITALKKSEDSDDLILRFYETSGKECTATVTLSETMHFDAVHKTDLLENEIEKIKTENNSFSVNVGKYSIETFRLIKDLY